jgi:hypothetical protein
MRSRRIFPFFQRLTFRGLPSVIARARHVPSPLAHGPLPASRFGGLSPGETAGTPHRPRANGESPKSANGSAWRTAAPPLSSRPDGGRPGTRGKTGGGRGTGSGSGAAVAASVWRENGGAGVSTKAPFRSGLPAESFGPRHREQPSEPERFAARRSPAGAAGESPWTTADSTAGRSIRWRSSI